MAARKAAGLTQVEVAGRLKQPQSYVSKYESGVRRLDVVEFLAVARAIGFDPGRLIEELEVESPARRYKQLRVRKGA